MAGSTVGRVTAGVSPETLNCLVDGELGPREADELQAALRADPRLCLWVCELLLLKAMVRRAYPPESVTGVPAGSA